MQITTQITLSNITVKVTDTHVHFQQNDPITGALHWIPISKGEVGELITFLKEIECH